MMFGLSNKIFIGLLTSIVGAFNHTKCVLLSNQKYMIQPAVSNFNDNEYSQEFHYYPFAVKLDRCIENCNTLNYLSNKVFAQNKTERVSLSVFNMITEIEESNPQ